MIIKDQELSGKDQDKSVIIPITPVTVPITNAVTVFSLPVPDS
jgi:hypothetical protein